jgi:hypothetical protein
LSNHFSNSSKKPIEDFAKRLSRFDANNHNHNHNSSARSSDNNNDVIAAQQQQKKEEQELKILRAMLFDPRTRYYNEKRETWAHDSNFNRLFMRRLQKRH